LKLVFRHNILYSEKSWKVQIHSIFATWYIVVKVYFHKEYNQMKTGIIRWYNMDEVNADCDSLTFKTNKKLWYPIIKKIV